MTPAPIDQGGGRPRARTLSEILDQQRERAVVGRETNAALRAHSAGYVALVADEPATVLDLGSGGGVPGLVVAVEHWTRARVVLLDASQRRCTYLELCVAALQIGERVAVHWARAEEAGRDHVLRAGHDVVLARSFGPPAVTAECAAPLLAVGGVLVVSDPPDATGDRWDAAALALLGLEREETRQVEGATYTRLRQVEACPDRFPRRPGVPTRRPLF
ncbi:hypothetical protein HC251_24645 [Iamia sp. SCSIO 61187]|uniref:RsmG family class I SAM-dependent methyltransferase n=1 Tax=Iamia sp. SCSIO 61187 TaxID=2722752 RepID=UPI001C624E11|nr:RsmG family class I SAM-dependent methyltransferase [Iamia sp. SCSIO 61187]QYG95305.1 hypothetical protein HC251_24645 [Iamia sp. SCSIO 61187]